MTSSAPPSSTPAGAPKVNKVEALKQAKDAYDVLQDLLKYSESGDFNTIVADEAKRADIEVRFRWFGVYQQKPNQGHFMLRIRMTGGQLSPLQLQTIGEIADRYARGFGDITTRQTIQLHWITLADLKPIFEKLWATGMTSQFACGDCPRNIVSCPLSGVLADEYADTTSLANKISDMYITGGHEFSNLPRKFKPSIGGCPDHCWLPHINDYAFYALPSQNPGDQARFGIMVGGGLSDTPMFAQPLRAIVRENQVVEVARALAHLFRDHGYREKRGRARLKFLVADKGWLWTRQTLEQILGYQLEHDDNLLYPPVNGRDHTGITKQKNGLYALGIPVERGRWTAAQMIAVAKLSQRFAQPQNGQPPRIRLSIRQNALLLDIPKQNLEPLSRELENVGLIPGAHPLRTSLVSCTGAEFCNLAVVETKHRAGRVLRWLEQNTPNFDQPLFISFTGCPNACAQYQIADIGLTGMPVIRPDKKDADGKPLKVDGYNVLLGAGLGKDPKFGQIVAKKIPGYLIHLSIKNLIDAYTTQRTDDEETFQQWVRRSDTQALQQLIEAPTKDPAAVGLE